MREFLLSYLGLRHAESLRNLVTKDSFLLPCVWPRKTAQSLLEKPQLSTVSYYHGSWMEQLKETPTWMELTPHAHVLQSLQVVWRVLESPHISGLSKLICQLSSDFWPKKCLCNQLDPFWFSPISRLLPSFKRLSMKRWESCLSSSVLSSGHLCKHL